MKRKQRRTKKRELQRLPTKSNGTHRTDQSPATILPQHEAETVLSHPNLHTAQRQEFATRFQQVHGNQQLQKTLSRSRQSEPQKNGAASSPEITPMTGEANVISLTPMGDIYWGRRRSGWPELGAFHAEVNRRFWEGVEDYPYGRRLDPDRTEDEPYIDMWLEYRDEVMQQQLNAEVAETQDQAALLAGTSAPTADEAEAVRDALVPPRNVDPSTGDPLDFVSEVDGETYETRIRNYLTTWIDDTYDQIAMGHGEAEHADEANLFSFDIIAEVCNAAKDEVDELFGDYNTGPPFEKDVNLFDQWTDENDDLAGMDEDQKKAKAKTLLEYAIQSDDDEGTVDTINKKHNAIINRTTIASGESEAEVTILDRVTTELADVHYVRLNEIDRAWPATASEGIIYMQRFRGETDLENRRILWDTFQTGIHEYIHTLADPAYEGAAVSFGGDETEEYNTMIEGTDSFLTEIVWTNVTPKVQSAELREKVEGPAYAAQPFDPVTVPSIEGQRYPSYDQTERIVEIVGINNLYAAYFLGRIDLLGF